MNYENSQQTINKIVITAYLSIVILNINELNSLIKRQRGAERNFFKKIY